MGFYEQVKSQLERDEGRSVTLYYDSLNIPTIGIGRNLKRPLSEDEIDYLFKNDYLVHLKEMLDVFPWVDQLNEPRKAALLNMAFNLGVPKLKGFVNMLLALKMGQWQKAHDHTLNSIWASQVHGRAVRIAKQFLTGEWI